MDGKYYVGNNAQRRRFSKMESHDTLIDVSWWKKKKKTGETLN